MIQLITKTPKATLVLMTKEVVDGLLALNTKNRPIRDRVVAAYARAITEDLWVTTNQGIGVTASGFLADGQHRLMALRATDYPPLTMLVMTGLADEVMAAVDGGANRTARDYLQFMFNTTVSALATAVLRTSLLAANNFTQTKFMPQEYVEHLESIGDSLKRCMAVEGASRLPGAVLAALVDIHSNGYGAEIERFMVALCTGEMLERNNSALLLRNWLVANRGSNGGAVMVERYRKTTSAAQAWIEGRSLGKLQARKYRPLRSVAPVASASAPA